MPPQPKGAQPENWVHRKDGTTEFAKEVKDLGLVIAELKGEVKQAVTWPKLTATLIVIFGATIAASERFASGSSSRSESAIAALERRHADEMRQLRADTLNRQDKQDAKLDALLRVNVEGQPRSVAKEELERRTGEKRDADYWKRNR